MTLAEILALTQAIRDLSAARMELERMYGSLPEAVEAQREVAPVVTPRQRRRPAAAGRPRLRVVREEVG